MMRLMAGAVYRGLPWASPVCFTYTVPFNLCSSTSRLTSLHSDLQNEGAESQGRLRSLHSCQLNFRISVRIETSLTLESHSKHLRQLLFQYCCTNHPRIQKLSVTLLPVFVPAPGGLPSQLCLRLWVSGVGLQLWVGFGSARVSHFVVLSVLSTTTSEVPR